MWAVIQLPHFHEYVYYIGLHSQLQVMRFAWKGSGFSCRKEHCIVIIVSFTYVDERTIVWLSVWASHMLTKETLCGCDCELCICWSRKHCVAGTSKLDMPNARNFRMGKTFRILLRYKMKYCEYSVHKLNDCFWVYSRYSIFIKM